MRPSSAVLDRMCAGSRWFGSWIVVSAMLLPQAARAENAKISVTVGQSVTQRIEAPIKTISVADSKVADVVVANTHEILLNGKAIGFTTVVVWDENNNSTLYDVVVRGPFSDEQIELQVQVAEVNRARAHERGIDFLFSDKFGTAASFAGGVAAPSVPLAVFGGGGASDGVTLAGRYVHGATELSAMIHALEADGVLHVLAKPNVVAASGQPAKFLSGGEIPVPIANSGSQGVTTITIEWKEFGIKVDFLPTIVDAGVINLQVLPEVSSVDFGNGIVLSGFRIPALRVRRASTTVELKDGEVLVIAGLMMEETNKRIQRVPILGHLPIIKHLFIRSSDEKTETELVLVVSPRIVHAQPKGSKVTLPQTEEPKE